MPNPMTPREYYRSVLKMLEYNRAMTSEQAKFAMDQYEQGNPEALDTALSLVNLGKGHAGDDAWAAYTRYRERAGQPVVDLPAGIYRDPTEEFSNVRYNTEKQLESATSKLVSALEAAKEAGYTGDETVPPPDTPTYRTEPKPKVNVTIGPAQDVLTVDQAQIVSPEEMKRRLRESRAAQEQAHKFMLGRPKYG
jgi:hypothetical protein